MLVDTVCGKLFVQITGRGPDLVLWHSLLSDTGMWKGQIPVLAERYRVISIDAPGHGRSSAVRARYTMDDCVQAAVAVMDAAEAPRAGWIGLSWGGMVGMRLAARHPERIAALVLLDTSARPERPWKKAAYKPLQAFAARLGPVRPLAKVLAPIMFSRTSLREQKAAVETFVQTLVRMDPESLSRAVDAVIFSRTDATDELSRITAPTLVIVGADDKATPPAEAEHLSAHIRGAGLVRIPDAGHLSALEQPAQVNSALLSFLGDNLA